MVEVGPGRGVDMWCWPYGGSDVQVPARFPLLLAAPGEQVEEALDGLLEGGGGLPGLPVALTQPGGG